jgi:hypothetical protein
MPCKSWHGNDTNSMLLLILLVAMDLSDQQVIVTIQGTQSLPDVLMDLMCHSVEFQRDYDGDELITRMVQGRFLKSEQLLVCPCSHELATETLVAHSYYELVIVRHSLGD